MPTSAAPRPTRARPRTSRRPRPGTARGWLTLVVLLLVVAVLSIGPSTLRELVSGLVFARPQAASIAVAPRHADVALQSRLADVAETLTSGRLSAEVVALQSGATASIEGNQDYPAASLFKLPILLEVLARADAGQLDLDQRVEIRAQDWTEGSGVLQARIGEQLSLRELARLMIQESDNIAALVLLDVVSVERVNSLADGLDLHATHLVDHRGGEEGDHTTSAGDMAQLLVLLASGQAVNQRVSEQALATLELKQSVNWLGDDLPFWVKVAHKWGDLPEARNDAGIVFTPRGNYAIAVLTENSAPGDAARAITRLSRATYDYLGNR